MKLEHIGIAVQSINERRKFWEKILGFRVNQTIEVSSRKVKVAECDVGGTKIEFLEPISDDSPIAKFLENKGEGIQHLCFEVENIEETIKNLKKEGIVMIDDVPRAGAFARKVAFIHPRSTYGVLIELCEK